MIARFMQTGFGQSADRLTVWGRNRLAAAKLPKRRSVAAALVAVLLAVLYWGIVASDRYVSEAHVVIHRTSLDNSKDTGSASSLIEQYLLRDYLRSADMLIMLESKLKLREHYSNWRRDPLSRMWFKDGPFEWFYRHYLTRISVELDMSAYVLVVKAQAYDAETAHAIATMLVEEGERYMNFLGHRMAEEQIAYLETQVAKLNERVSLDRYLVMGYQNKKGLVSPQSTAENIVGIISRLEVQLAELQTRHSAMQEYMMPDSPGMVDLNMQIAAVEKQIARERARLASPGGQGLNRTVEEYQRLQMNAELSTAVYKTALTALEQGRIEATRKLMQVFVLQSPTKPQYPLEPQRIYNIVVSILIIVMITGIVNLLAAIIRDHKD